MYRVDFGNKVRLGLENLQALRKFKYPGFFNSPHAFKKQIEDSLWFLLSFSNDRIRIAADDLQRKG